MSVDQPKVTALLAALLRQPSDRLRLVLSTRADPALPDLSPAA